MKLMRSSRHTVMSGEVVTFAASFETVHGLFGLEYEAKGPFEVSASRDAVVVHRAVVAGPEECALLRRAIAEAQAVFTSLSDDQWPNCGGRPYLYGSLPVAVG